MSQTTTTTATPIVPAPRPPFMTEWSAIIVSIIGLIALLACLVIAYLEKDNAMINHLVDATIVPITLMIYNYHLGSSKGSTDKSATLASIATNKATTNQ